MAKQIAIERSAGINPVSPEMAQEAEAADAVLKRFLANVPDAPPQLEVTPSDSLFAEQYLLFL